MITFEHGILIISFSIVTLLLHYKGRCSYWKGYHDGFSERASYDDAEEVVFLRESVVKHVEFLEQLLKEEN